MVTPNLETIERLIRIMFGFVLFIISYQANFSFMVNFIIVFFGFLMIFTGVSGWCYLYVLFKSSKTKFSLKPISVSQVRKEIKMYKDDISLIDVKKIKNKKAIK